MPQKDISLVSNPNLEKLEGVIQIQEEPILHCPNCHSEQVVEHSGGFESLNFELLNQHADESTINNNNTLARLEELEDLLESDTPIEELELIDIEKLGALERLAEVLQLFMSIFS